jgi:hypothetical protein
MGADEVVETPDPFEVVCEGLMSAGMAETAAQIRTTWLPSIGSTSIREVLDLFSSF